MDVFLKSVAGILITLILCQVLLKNGKDISVLLILAACSMVLLVAGKYLQPIVEFLRHLQTIGNLNNEALQILFKAVGIGLITEIVVMICNDAGNAVLGKGLQILAITITLWLSLPILNEFLNLLETILRTV